jgi:glutamate dehydrogenase/leucine dehydrogenase
VHPADCGGSGNPSFATENGVIFAMTRALRHLGLGDVRDKTFAVQGLGHVATAMIGELVERGAARIVATDISDAALAAASQRFAGAPVELELVNPGDDDILRRPCDIVAPCALGGVLNPDTIPNIAARIVCGAANNQLLDDERDSQLLLERGITYVPDFVANRMGIVSCANEQYGLLPHDPAILRHFDADWDGSVSRVTERVLERSQRDGVTPSAAANALSDEQSQKPHPLWGHRTELIIAALVAGGWSDQSQSTIVTS